MDTGPSLRMVDIRQGSLVPGVVVFAEFLTKSALRYELSCFFPS